jgi:hypothetical protein
MSLCLPVLGSNACARHLAIPAQPTTLKYHCVPSVSSASYCKAVCQFWSVPTLFNMLRWHLDWSAALHLSCITSKSPRSLQVGWRDGYWAGDLDVKCYQGWHLTLVVAVGVPGVLLVCIGVPATLALLLLRSRLQQHQQVPVYKFGFLLACYR